MTKEFFRRKLLHPLQRNSFWQELFAMRMLIVFGLMAMIFFLVWFFHPDHKGTSVLYWLLTGALMFKLLRWLHEWYHYFSVGYPKAPEQKQEGKVDMLTTFCAGEPYDMILETLQAMKEVRYPHTTYLCDEANDPFLKKKCEELGVIHVTRKEKINAKAGNINNALKQATGNITVILDPDHKPSPNFLDVVLPHFENPEIGFVQVVQAYSNQTESMVARGAAQQTYHFYGPIMMGMNSYGTTQAIGANCAFRREALDSIGGHAPGLAEDMHTAMQLHAKGWKSVYVPEVLTRGLVPSSLSAYYKQQLKWSRGTFELLFTTYPRLFSKLTWRQKLHYFTIPLHYLSGLVTTVDILIPILALLLAEPVWKVNLGEFAKVFLPLFFFAMLIRQYAQRWLAEPRERGMHLMGGFLRMGTWWIFNLGLISTFLRVKIPYIPTPKNDEPVNDWKLAIPNLVTAAICLAAIPIGLSLDWTPFSIFMASFSLINAFCLIFIALIGQQKLLNSIKSFLLSSNKTASLLGNSKAAARRYYFHSLHYLRKSAIGLAIFFFIFAFSAETHMFQQMFSEYDLSKLEPSAKKDNGGFYVGAYIPEVEKKNSFDKLDQVEKTLNTNLDIVSIYIAWGPDSGAEFPDSMMREIVKRNSIPMLTIEPWTWPFPEYRDHPDLCCEKKVLQYISAGYFDKYLTDYSQKLKALDHPVMVRFAHEFDNPAYPWSTGGGNSPEDFVKAWQYVVNYFDSMAVGNVTWIWNPWEEDGLEKYWPGDEYVDWIGITNLNYGYAASNGKWYSSEDLYKPFSEKIKKYNKPVMLTEFGSTTFGGDQAKWLGDAFRKIKTNYDEVKGVVFFYSDQDPHWGFTNWRPADSSKVIDWTFSSKKSLDTALYYIHQPHFKDNRFFEKGATVVLCEKTAPAAAPASKRAFIKGKAENFELIVDGKPFYIKGLVYNPGHDWRDGDVPLTRSKLTEDFQRIKAMGANTIRRYEPSFYDRNILNVAQENDLKVLYGFWFENDVNYHLDEKILQEYSEKVASTVKKYKDEPAVLGWVIGNEVWGLLKKNYEQPYRYKVRKKYVEFIEQLAQQIHAIDPTRPIFLSEEHTSQLPAAIEAFREGAPSVDVFGVNSYYHKHIRKLQGEIMRYDPNRPYLISEFGPEGYWQDDFTPNDPWGAVTEEGGVAKAARYAERWNDQILPNKGCNIGGIAYCWSDRMEGTATWFGMTDMRGRLKPQYCAMKEAWTGKSCDASMNEIYIFSPEYAVEAGKEYSFFAVADNPGSQKLHYEWYLCKDEFVQMKNYRINISDDGRQVSLKIPNEPSNYRLYVNVYNDKGYCNTASKPLEAFRK